MKSPSKKCDPVVSRTGIQWQNHDKHSGATSSDKDLDMLEENKMKVATGAKILIVDDEKDLVEMLVYNLGRKGYNTLRAYDGCW